MADFAALQFAGILAVAQHSSQGLPVLSGVTLAKMKNSGASDAVILDFVQKGITEQRASEYIAQREHSGRTGWVYQGHRRTRR